MKKYSPLVFIFLIVFTSVKLFTQNLIINELMSSNSSTIVDYNGNTSDWIEIYNNSSTTINLKGYYLSDDDDELNKWEFPNVSLLAKDFLIIWASSKNTVYPNGELHTNFKIKSSGESIFLVESDGTTIIEQSPSRDLDADISIGHEPNNFTEWYTFTEATPGQPNTTSGYLWIAEKPVFSHQRGFYKNPFGLTLTPKNIQDTIYYTLDGSNPDKSSAIYSNQIMINTTTVLRIKVYRGNALPSNIFTTTFFFEDINQLATISLVTQHSNLWGNEGIYTNYNSGEERPVHVEYFKEDGATGFFLDMGVKIHAPDNKPQKSLRLYARSEYGTKNINYKIFKNLSISKFKRLVLRNGGNDGAKLKKTHIRDAFTHKIYKQLNPENAIAAYKPLHVFINGYYWGIYNLRERQDEYYIKENFGYEKDEIDFLEYDYAEPGYKKTIAGNWDDFEDLKSFVIDNDMSVGANYNIMSERMDMDNFIDYQIIEIFIGNQDWLNNNIKFWRPKLPGGKWKWILWDTEYGLGTNKNYPVGEPNFNFFTMAMSWGGWGNDDYTWLLRNLMENSEFKNKFITRTLDLLNTIYLPSYTNPIFQSLANNINTDIQKQFDKWGSNQTLWEADIDYAKYYLTECPHFLRQHIAQYFGFNDDLSDITVNVSNTDQGMVKINTILIDKSTPGIDNLPYPWTGSYYVDQSITVKAIAKQGYRFIKWDGEFSSHDDEISFMLNHNITLTAIFNLIDSVDESEESNKQLQLSIYPIPATNNITIEIVNNIKEKLSLQFYNIAGQLLFSKEVSNFSDSKFNVDVSYFQNGIYITKLISERGFVRTKKFSVQHN